MKRRTLTDAERELWRRMTKDVTPIGDGPTTTLARRAVAPVVHKTPALQKNPTRLAADLFQAGDPRLDKRAARGKIEIDAELDLHGHTQSTAETALYGFLLKARANGQRCVLVITGKGAAQSTDNYNIRTVGRERGVLHRLVREWVNTEPFRQHITRVAPAHQRHGGDGAVYIFLKSKAANARRRGS